MWLWHICHCCRDHHIFATSSRRRTVTMINIVLNVFFPDTSDFRTLVLDVNSTVSGLRNVLLGRMDRATSEGDIFQVC